jgi:hypothetical protein
MRKECRHIKPNGRQCESPALHGTPYCYFHTRLHRLAAAPPSAPDAPLKFPILEDRSAIQLALAQVFDALGSSRIDPRRAGLFFYGLQIASQNVERGTTIVSRLAVPTMTVTPSGDELAPEASYCWMSDHCYNCDQRDTCEDRDPDGEEEEEEEEEDDGEEEDSEEESEAEESEEAGEEAAVEEAEGEEESGKQAAVEEAEEREVGKEEAEKKEEKARDGNDPPVFAPLTGVND